MSYAAGGLAVVAAAGLCLTVLYRATSARAGGETRLAAARGLNLIALLVMGSVIVQALGEARYGAGAPIPLPSSLLTALNALLLATLATSVLVRLGQRRPPTRWSLAVGLMPFAIAWALATRLGAYEGASSRAWFVWLTFIGVVLSVEQGPHLLSVARLVARVVIAASVTAALLWPGWAFAPYSTWPGGWRPGVDRLQGIFPQPNPLGWFAALALLIELFGSKRSLRARVLWSSAAGACLVLSGSRSAAFAFLTGLFLGVLSGTPHRKASLRRLSLAILAGAVLVIGVLSITKASGTMTQGVNGRTSTWAVARDVFERNPDFGSGPGAYVNAPGTGTSVPYAHNQPLHTAAEMGLAGLLALAWATLFVGARAFTRMRTPLSAAAAGSWMALYGTENLFRFTEMTFFLPVLLAILCWGCTAQHPAERASHGPSEHRRPPPRRRIEMSR